MADILDIAVPTTAIYRFGSSYDGSIGFIPGFYSSKDFTGEDASSRVKWRAVVFHGEGTITVNVYCDNTLILKDQIVTMSETPDQQRVVNLPRSKSTAYMMRYDYRITSGYVRFVEIYYDTVSTDAN